MTLRTRWEFGAGQNKNETANRGDTVAVSHFQIRDGGWGDRSALIQLCSFEGGDAQLATVLRDNGASAFALDSYPLWQLVHRCVPGLR